MKVLLLAAGRSKRMKPITDKNFLMFLGKPLIQYQLELLHESGFDDLIVVGGNHNLEKIKNLAKSLKMKVEICEQEDLDLGMAGAVLAAKNKINNSPVLILSSNDVVEQSAFKLIKKAAKDAAAESFILGKEVKKYFPGGYLEIDKNGYIKNIIEKPEPGNEPSNLINLVVHLHKNPKKIVEYLEKVKSNKDDRYEVALAAMMKDGCKMRALEYKGFWQPIKYPWQIHNLFLHFIKSRKKSISKSAKIAKRAVINGNVIIGNNVKIYDNAVIDGPCYIGDNCVIATNALVRESNIGANCVIGFGSEIARSYLGDNVWTHCNYIGDSVIGNNVSFGSGTVIGNLRLDEQHVKVDYDGKKINTESAKFGAIIGDNVRVGINVSLMPGIKIGNNSFIGAGIVIAENIPDNTFVRGTWKLKMSENKFDKLKSRDQFKDKL